MSISRKGGRLVIRDLGSKNGSYVDGERVVDSIGRPSDEPPRVVRFGSTLALFVPDIAPFLDEGVTVKEQVVVGPALRRVLLSIEAFARTDKTIHLVGETGVGKELGARAYHAALGNASRPFVAVNCAAVPPTIAERLLFGAKRGAYSGADTDTEGFVQAAHGGTLFLDEVAELDATLQAKLLRVLETGEVARLGATRTERVDLRVCTATNVDLRERVAAGTFRRDLYYRLGRPSVTIPPLRERPEEIPYLVHLALANVDPAIRAHPELVDECLRRPWPGNVRELIVEARCAAQLALVSGHRVVRSSTLAVTAGRALVASGERSDAEQALPALEDSVVDAALDVSAGNVSEAARRLGIHRAKLRRVLQKRGK